MPLGVILNNKHLKLSASVPPVPDADVTKDGWLLDKVLRSLLHLWRVRKSAFHLWVLKPQWLFVQGQHVPEKIAVDHLSPYNL